MLYTLKHNQNNGDNHMFIIGKKQINLKLQILCGLVLLVIASILASGSLLLNLNRVHGIGVNTTDFVITVKTDNTGTSSNTQFSQYQHTIDQPIITT